LSEGLVDVWYATLDDFTNYQANMASVLSPPERYRASRYKSFVDRRRFILKRGLLRYILSEYLEVNPGHIRFFYKNNGKPVLQTLSGGEEVHFNLSHSNGIAVYAVTRCAEVGIDVEHISDMPDWRDLVMEHFTPKEQAIFDAIPKANQLRAFYQGWTRKEAIVKASGQGIGDGLRQIEVFLLPHQSRISLFYKGSEALNSQWVLYDLFNHISGVACALAVQASAVEVRIGTCNAPGR
jgi:4'-phosphopantetheinyl transferase